MSEFENRLKKLREDAGITQKQLACSLNVTQTAVNYWENGKREPNVDMIRKIADYFDVTPAYIMGWEDKESIYTLSTFIDEIDEYLEDIGKFLYSNPDHRVLFDASMEVKSQDVNLAKEMLDRINGKILRYPKTNKPVTYVNAAHPIENDEKK